MRRSSSSLVGTGALDIVSRNELLRARLVSGAVLEISVARPAPNTVTLGRVWSAAPPPASVLIVEFDAPILPPVAGEGRLSTDIDVCRAVRRGDGGATAAADRARPGGSPLDSQLSNKIEVLFAQTPHCLAGHEWDKWRLRWRDLSAVHRQQRAKRVF